MSVNYEDIDRVFRTEYDDLEAIVSDEDVEYGLRIRAAWQQDYLNSLRADIAGLFYDDLDSPEAD